MSGGMESMDFDEKRIDQVGQNGNGGEHYADLKGSEYLKSSINSSTPEEWNRSHRATARSSRGSPLDTQVGGDHYKKLGQYQPWQVLKKWLTPEEFKGAMKKEVITYLAREADKGGRQDIEKAMHTLQIYFELTSDESK